MIKTKIVFFPDPPNDETNHLLKELKQHNMCYRSSNADEFDQVFRQSGRFVIVFSSVTFTLKFLEKNVETLKELQFKTYSFLKDQEVLSKEDQELLNKHKVTLFKSNKSDDIKKNISLFFEDLIFEN